MTDHKPHEIAALADAMADLLSDMGKDGQSVCGFAKAKARLAYEPFRADPEAEEGIMPLEAVRGVMLACDCGW